MYSSMDADADVEDIGLDAKQIDDVVAAYDAVEYHEDRAEDYFTILAVIKKKMLLMV